MRVKNHHLYIKCEFYYLYWALVDVTVTLPEDNTSCNYKVDLATSDVYKLESGSYSLPYECGMNL